MKEYFDRNIDLDKADDRYISYQVYDMWNAYKKGYEQREKETKHEIQ